MSGVNLGINPEARASAHCKARRCVRSSHQHELLHGGRFTRDLFHSCTWKRGTRFLRFVLVLVTVHLGANSLHGGLRNSAAGTQALLGRT